MKTVFIFIVIWNYGGQPLSVQYKTGAQNFAICQTTAKFLQRTDGAYQLSCIPVTPN